MAGLLVLWDVDYTLVDAGGVGQRLYQLAFTELYGIKMPDIANEANMAGRTDRAISLDVLRLAGVADPRADVDRFESALAKLAPSVADLVAATSAAMPGARAALAAIAAIGDGAQAAQSLLTGNVRALAEAKLGPFGLLGYLDLDVGAYGNEHEERAELVGLARSRAAAAYLADFGGEATVVVGDTPLDVRAALVTGARAVGVATGRFAEADLASAGAHAVLADLTDLGEVLAAVLTSRGPRSAARAPACPG